MGWDFVPLLSLELQYDVHAVDGQSPERVDGHAEETGVCLQENTQSIVIFCGEKKRKTLSNNMLEKWVVL